MASANRNQVNTNLTPNIHKSFVRAGTKIPANKPTSSANPSLLNLANDWDFQIDLDGSFKWPLAKILTGDVRPDTMFVSHSKQIVIWGELTAPMERRMLESALKKKKHYHDLKAKLLILGWKVYDMTFEVGALGFLSNTVGFFLRQLGFPPNQRAYMKKRMAKISLRSSFYIWCARSSRSWNPPTLASAHAHSSHHHKDAIEFLAKINPSPASAIVPSPSPISSPLSVSSPVLSPSPSTTPISSTPVSITANTSIITASTTTISTSSASSICNISVPESSRNDKKILPQEENSKCLNKQDALDKAEQAAWERRTVTRFELQDPQRARKIHKAEFFATHAVSTISSRPSSLSNARPITLPPPHPRRRPRFKPSLPVISE